MIGCLLSVVVVAIASSDITPGESVILTREEGKQPFKQPQVACATDGSIHVAYGSNDAVYYSHSNDAQSSTTPVEAFRCPNLSLGMRHGPRIAVAGTVPVITAIGGPQGKGRDGDLQAWRMAAESGSWSGPVNVTDVPASAREGQHGMTAGPDGSVWATWLDLRET